MPPLPFVDEHVREIGASSERVWRALLVTVGQLSPELPRWLTKAWGLQHTRRIGAWGPTVAVGDTVPGFVVAEIEPLRLLRLRGRHRFSDYELSFGLEHASAEQTCLRATTSAAFPGIIGRVYQALVIGTRGHRVAVRRILGSVAQRAERDTSG